MQEQKVEQEIDITKLSNEFTYRKYMMSRDSVIKCCGICRAAKYRGDQRRFRYLWRKGISDRSIGAYADEYP